MGNKTCVDNKGFLPIREIEEIFCSSLCIVENLIKEVEEESKIFNKVNRKYESLGEMYLDYYNITSSDYIKVGNNIIKLNKRNELSTVYKLKIFRDFEENEG